jgi:hypothetical protein
MPTWSSHAEIAGSHGFVIVRPMFLAPFIGDLTCGPAGGGDRSAVGYSLSGRAEWILYAERVVQTPEEIHAAILQGGKGGSGKQGGGLDAALDGGSERVAGMFPADAAGIDGPRAPDAGAGSCRPLASVAIVVCPRQTSGQCPSACPHSRRSMASDVDAASTSEAPPYGRPSSFRALSFASQMKV